MLNETNVTELYMLLLGRSPESDEIINEKIKSHKDIESLVKDLLTSDEFTWKWKDTLTDSNMIKKFFLNNNK